ncbi:MAG: acyl-CoA dehydrogenase [Verrucomicrobia bacterium]|nr:acyl-CoA dehydrogenase [Verrucomicrobiota bacterium]
MTKPLPPHLTGGAFLLGPSDPSSVFIPEELTSDQRQMTDTAEKFMDKEVLSQVEALEHQTEGLAQKLFKKAGQIGLLGVEVPEAYGGLGLGKRDSMGVAEQLTRLGGFGVTCGAHSGIGTQPLVYFGNEDQKTRYLPRLATGEWMAAYCLSEPQSGSDALAMRTKAVKTPDGRGYVLNGTKMWISNAGWADLFTVFAKVDGQHVTAFLVEKTFAGVSTGKEEHKLGLKTSSTRRVVLEDVVVPVENVLGEVGKGAYIAFNILNFGRFGLGAGAVGASRDLMRIAVRYANEREQFGRRIASFGLIQHKLAEMASLVFAAESAAYRTAGGIDEVMATGETMDSMQPAFPRALDELALECSILKVACSEALDRVADETLQIHGGYGYTEEFPAARGYRDSRINRIFEGTNEINRLFIPGTLLRRAQRGRFPLMAAVTQVSKSVLDAPAPEESSDSLVTSRNWLESAKRTILLLSGIAYQKFGEKLAEQQEVLMALSDMIIQVYLGESAVLRVLKLRGSGTDVAEKADMAVLGVNESVIRVEHAARTLLAAVASGDELRTQMGILRRWLRWTPLNTVALRRRIAERMCAN